MFCICKNKEADQLRSNHKADHRLCFRYIDRTIPLLSKSEISSLVSVEPGRKPKRWFSHDTAHILFPLETPQKGDFYDFQKKR